MRETSPKVVHLLKKVALYLTPSVVLIGAASILSYEPPLKPMPPAPAAYGGYSQPVVPGENTLLGPANTTSRTASTASPNTFTNPQRRMQITARQLQPLVAASSNQSSTATTPIATMPQTTTRLAARSITTPAKPNVTTDILANTLGTVKHTLVIARDLLANL